MSAARPTLVIESPAVDLEDFDLERAVAEIDDWDRRTYLDLISTELSPEQQQMMANPEQIFPRQDSVMAVHWHPEWVGLDLVARRVVAMFPNSANNLIIPTQHNRLMVMGDYAGLEMDAFSSGFNRKVQLLLHFKADKADKAGVLTSMAEHTFKYRSSQLFEFMDTTLNPKLADRFDEAVAATGAGKDLIAFVRFYTARLKALFEEYEQITPPEMIKNKLLTEYVNALREKHPDKVVNRAGLLLRAVKAVVKSNFSLDYFFRASEIIEETRALGGGVVIPHPEQFWPILLADYDVDGYEVWNPQSREFTDFLIRALNNQNKRLPAGRRQLLVFMGDDTHLSAKLKAPTLQDPAKAGREIGLQPPWDEVAVRKSLSLSGASRGGMIDAYRERLG